MHLSLSFAPDGTAVGASTNNLFQRLSTAGSVSAWQSEVLRALQTWAVQANINVGIVPDGGQAFGTPGLVQGDPRFGDLRVAGYAMPKDVIGLTGPFEAMGGTWSGDVKFNTSYSLGLNGQGAYDFFTIALHELGHAFGLDCNNDPTSIMFGTYQGARTGLGASDIAAIRALYGARSADQYEGSGGNGSLGNATQLSFLNIADGLTTAVVEGDLTKLNDNDFYRFTVPLSPTGATVRVETLGLSLAAPRVTVYNALGNVIKTVASPGPNGGNLEIRLDGFQLLSTYYVKVEGATDDVFGIGGYRLVVDTLPGVTGVVQAAGGVLGDVSSLLNIDLHTNDSILTATLLPQLFAGANSRFDYAFRGSISDGWDVDYYAVKAPVAAAGANNVMTVMAWGLKLGELDPRVNVYDAAGKLVASQILVNEAESFTIQLPNAVSGATYFVRIQDAIDSPSDTGNYFLGVDYGPKVDQLYQIAGGSVDAVGNRDILNWTVSDTRLVHLTLSAKSPSAQAGARMTLTILDAAGQTVYTGVTKAGQTISANVLLKAGKYKVRLVGSTASGSPLAPLSYALAGALLDGPIGPQPNDTTGKPSGQDSGYESPWWTGGSSNGQTQPYGDPYSNV